MEHATQSVLNETLSEVTIYSIVTKKGGASVEKKKKNERKKASRVFLKTYLKHKHTCQYLPNITALSLITGTAIDT